MFIFLSPRASAEKFLGGEGNEKKTENSKKFPKIAQLCLFQWVPTEKKTEN